MSNNYNDKSSSFEELIREQEEENLRKQRLAAMDDSFVSQYQDDNSTPRVTPPPELDLPPPTGTLEETIQLPERQPTAASMRGASGSQRGSAASGVVPDEDEQKKKEIEDAVTERYKAAQNRRRGATNAANIFDAVGTVGAGLAGQKADSSFYDRLRAEADSGVKDVSQELDTKRKAVQQAIDEKYKQDSLDSREADRSEARAMRRTITDQGRHDKDDKRTDDLIRQLKDDLDPNKARGGNLAKSQGMINSSESIEALFSQFPDGNVPKSQTVELATGVAALISRGTPQSQHQIDQLVPSSMRGDAQSIASWVTGKPLGQEQQKFIRLLQDTAKREKEVAEHQVRSAQVQRLSAYSKLKSKDPERYNQVLAGYGIDEKDIDKNGRYAPAKIVNETFPRQVRKGKHVATVSNEKELSEANAEGFQ